MGLSASLTYAVGHRAVEEALNNLCDDLDVTKMISPSDEELLLGGYLPQDDTIEMMHKPWDVPKGVLDGACQLAFVAQLYNSELTLDGTQKMKGSPI